MIESILNLVPFTANFETVSLKLATVLLCIKNPRLDPPIAFGVWVPSLHFPSQNSYGCLIPTLELPFYNFQKQQKRF